MKIITKILITGSRIWKNKIQLHKILKEELKEEDVIIHGGAPGVDSLTEKWCKQHDIKTIIIRPTNPSRRECYLQRNAEMIGMTERVIAFISEKSGGTGFTIAYAIKRGRNVLEINENKKGVYC